MNPATWIRGLFDRGPILRQDRDVWAAATTLTDLGDLTARWLQGEIQSQPGYYGPCDVDETDAPGLTDTLIALNRAGYVTNSSQAGFDGVGYDGAHWTQLAAVSGFCGDDTFAWLQTVPAHVAWFGMYAYPPASGRTMFPKRQPVGTLPADGPIRRRLPASHFRSAYGECGDGAVEALLDAWQVVVYDPQPGRNTLWPALRAAAQAQTAAA